MFKKLIDLLKRVMSFEIREPQLGEPEVPAKTERDPLHEAVYEDIKQAVLTEFGHVYYDHDGDPLVPIDYAIFIAVGAGKLALEHGKTCGQVEAQTPREIKLNNALCLAVDRLEMLVDKGKNSKNGTALLMARKAAEAVKDVEEMVQ